MTILSYEEMAAIAERIEKAELTEDYMDIAKDATVMFHTIKVLRRALFLSCRWTIESKPHSIDSCEGGMGHFIQWAEKELKTEV